MKPTGSPCLMVTAHDGRTMPTLRAAAGTPTEVAAAAADPPSSDTPYVPMPRQRRAAASSTLVELTETLVVLRPVESSFRVPTNAVRYDRVLADVPCSGDGTLRKTPSIFKDFSPANALSLHYLQASLAKHAVGLLKVCWRTHSCCVLLSPALCVMCVECGAHHGLCRLVGSWYTPRAR